MNRGPMGARPSWVVAAIGLLLGLMHLGRPGLSADEGSTLAAVRLSWGQLTTVVQHVDLVHTAYYAVLHVWVDVAGTSAFAARVPSVVFIAAACGLVAAIGEQLDDRRTGWYAGACALVIPGLTWPGLDARPAALAVLLATLATWLLLRAGGSTSRRRWLPYAGCVLALVLVQLLAILIVLPHALLVSRADRRRWFVAAAVTVAAATPFVIAAQRQSEQIAWLVSGGGDVVSALGGRLTSGPSPAGWPALGSAAVLVIVLGLTAVAAGTPRPRRVGLHVWAFGPPVLVVGVSLLAEPMYAERYVAWCLPPFAILAGRGLARLPQRPAAVLLIALAICAVPAWSAQRGVDSKGGERTREQAALVQRADRDSGAVLFLDTSTRTLEAAYPDVFEGLQDLSRLDEPAPDDALLARNAPTDLALAAVAESGARSVVVVYRNRAPFTGRTAMQQLARDGCRLTATEAGTRNAVALWSCP